MDCPGLYDTRKSQVEISTVIVQAVVCTHPGPHAVLYIIRLGRYTEEEFGVYKRLKALFDDDITKYIIVLFTGGDELEAEGKSLAEMIHLAPPSLLQVIEECKNRCLVFNNKTKNTKPQVERLLEEVRKLKEINDDEYYTCPKYSNVGEGLEAEVHRRLAEVEQKDLEREKYVKDLEAKTKAAEKAVEEARTELKRNNQRREQEIEQEKERFKQEAHRLHQDLKAKERELDAERRKLQLKALQDEQSMVKEKKKEEDKKRDEEELARLRENLKAKERELDAERKKQEEKALDAEMYRIQKEENLRKKKQEDKLREEEELARLQQQMKELEMERREEERREQQRKERAYQEELNRMKDSVAKNEEQGWVEWAAEGVTSVVAAPFKLFSSWFG